MPHAPLPHTADTGIEASAPTFIALVEELATGMFELMATADCPDAVTMVTADVEASTREDLVVDTLSELLYLFETEDLHLCRFEVTAPREGSLHVRAVGVPIADVEPTGPPIKAVTYHQIEISGTPEGWAARVYFDV
ncbi:MAG TPA: archease [Acidimicrobiia bacterium]|nr:archease [Acidimicrobiia bacterium]